MIPKIIHYTWFSSDPIPEKLQKCIDSWHQCMPEYEFRKWDADSIKDIDSVWLKECIENKMWAFAADYVRLYAVFHCGGIYLDTDCMVFRSFDDVLDNRFFIGRESVPYVLLERQVNVFLTSHCFGAEAGHPFCQLMLEYYEGRHFLTSQSQRIPKHLRLDMMMMPYQHSEIAKLFGYDASLKANAEQLLEEGIHVYPRQYFGEMTRKPNDPFQHCLHLGAGSWREKRGADCTRYTVGYKIGWRVVAAYKWLIEKTGYLPIKY